jgi:hypothetical protein
MTRSRSGLAASGAPLKGDARRQRSTEVVHKPKVAGSNLAPETMGDEGLADAGAAKPRPLELSTLVVDPRDGDWHWRRATIARFLGFDRLRDAIAQQMRSLHPAASSARLGIRDSNAHLTGPTMSRRSSRT